MCLRCKGKFLGKVLNLKRYSDRVEEQIAVFHNRGIKLSPHWERIMVIKSKIKRDRLGYPRITF